MLFISMFTGTALIQLSSLLETTAVLLHIVALKYIGGNHVYENLIFMHIDALLFRLLR